MKITRNASAPSMPGKVPENFSGTVRVDNLASTDTPSRVGTGVVTFSPGARTNWHTHPAGQTIIVTAGKGWVQREGGPKEAILPGDTIFFAAGEKTLAWRDHRHRHDPHRDHRDGRRDQRHVAGAGDRRSVRRLATARFAENIMAEEPTNARKSFGDLAPKLAEITDKILFGDVWVDDTLSPRDRSLVTIANLAALYRTNELPFHLKKGLENGLSQDEIVAVITHTAFYSGWPTAMTALNIAREVFKDA